MYVCFYAGGNFSLPIPVNPVGSGAGKCASCLDSGAQAEYNWGCMMRDRPMAGQRPLEPLIMVRIHVSQLI